MKKARKECEHVESGACVACINVTIGAPKEDTCTFSRATRRRDRTMHANTSTPPRTPKILRHAMRANASERAKSHLAAAIKSVGSNRPVIVHGLQHQTYL